MWVSDDEGNTDWVMCGNPDCSTWYHVDCTDIDTSEDVEVVMWLCSYMFFSPIISSLKLVR